MQNSFITVGSERNVSLLSLLSDVTYLFDIVLKCQ